jgi:diguanylate cyclase (GGDEF)-like protein
VSLRHPEEYFTVIPAAPTPDETRRLRTLHALGLLDTPAEERFDRITRMAQRVFDVPISLISLVDENRQWFKSRQGLDAVETPRNVSFCGHAIHGDSPMVVPDASQDVRFADNPYVTDGLQVRFYAGCPISAPDGSKLGTLCVIDSQPRTPDEKDLAILAQLAEMVEVEIAAMDAAITDDLTGLTNRRGFHLLAPKVLLLCERLSLPAVMVYADLDGLKPINDRLGHKAGDRAIITAASVLARAFRNSDLVARLGGDEFAALLVGTSDPSTPLQRLEQGVLEHNTARGNDPVSLSIGSAEFDPAHPIELDELIGRADKAMYRQKHIRKSGPHALA